MEELEDVALEAETALAMSIVNREAVRAIIILISENNVFFRDALPGLLERVRGRIDRDVPADQATTRLRRLIDEQLARLVATADDGVEYYSRVEPRKGRRWWHWPR
jgi:hypothetical protein